MASKTSFKEGAGNESRRVHKAESNILPELPNAVSTLLGAGISLAGPQELAGREPYVIVRDKEGGERIEWLPHATPAPLADHIRQVVTLQDGDSFVRYVKRFALGETLIFARLPGVNEFAGAGFTAVLDYHAGGKGEAHAPRRTAHRAEFPCPLSPQFAAWLEYDREPRPQMEFVDFIEANARDIQVPDSATLMELALNFASRSEVKFASKIDRTTGGRALHFSEEVTMGQTNAGPLEKMRVPDRLVLRFPIFVDDKPRELGARLQYKVSNGRLSIAYVLERPWHVLVDAFRELRAWIKEETGLEPLTGAPKA